LPSNAGFKKGTRARSSSFTVGVVGTSVTVRAEAFSSNTSRRQGSTRRATRSIAFGTRVPPNCSMPGCVWNVCSNCWGTKDIEVTRRYARLTDTTREQEYFRAMAVIEKGEIDGTY